MRKVPEPKMKVVEKWVMPPSQFPEWYTEQWAVFWSDDNGNGKRDN